MKVAGKFNKEIIERAKHILARSGSKPTELIHPLPPNPPPCDQCLRYFHGTCLGHFHIFVKTSNEKHNSMIFDVVT